MAFTAIPAPGQSGSAVAVKTITAQAPSFAAEFDSIGFYDPSTGGDSGWKTNYGHGAQYGPWAWNSRTLGTELQVYTDPGFTGTGTASLGLDPFRIGGGHLTIEARKVAPATAEWLAGHDWSSGLITTEKSFAQTYGYFEMRARLPAGNGLWPAFWLLPLQGDGGTEIDVMEQTGGDEVFQTIHRVDGSSESLAINVPGVTGEFHTYGLLWTAETITFLIDGRATTTLATPGTMHQPMYILANLAVSGDGWAGRPDPHMTAGDLTIDYIRAYALADPRPEALREVTGTAAGDRLTGSPWGDRLRGLAGHDTYRVDHPADVVIEQAGGGTDRVQSLISFALPAHVEALELLGLRNADATGNGLANRLTGNEGRNTLRGLEGNDTLIGGADRDLLLGGAGNDIYLIQTWYMDGTDRIIEHAGEGYDTVRSGIDVVLPANVEQLILIEAPDAIAASGNALNNRITGNALANRIVGGAGQDRLSGGAGGDTFVFSPGSGHDLITDFGSGDRLALPDYLNRGVKPVIRTDGADLLLDLGTGSVRLKDMTPDRLQSDAEGFVHVSSGGNGGSFPPPQAALWGGDMPQSTVDTLL